MGGDATDRGGTGVRDAMDERREVGVEPSELGLVLTPRQILGGFALLAALIMLLRRGRRNRDRSGRD